MDTVKKVYSLGHSFSINLALELNSVDLAIIINTIQIYKVTDLSVKNLLAIFPYWSKNKISRLRKQLLNLHPNLIKIGGSNE